MTTTSRLDNVIANQRFLKFFSVAATVAMMSSLGVSILAMF